jgi:recombinational DNA repair protein RecR
MAYTPELSDYHSATLRRIAWALGKPMTTVIESIFDNMDALIDPGKVCKRCKDRSRCESCYFNTERRINEDSSLDVIKRVTPVA